MLMDQQISRSLLAAYTGVFYIDLVNDSYIPAKRQGEVYQIIKEIGSAQEAISTAIKKTVQPEYLEKVLRFVDLRTLSERMKSGHCIDREYKGVISGWVRGSFIEVERDPMGNLTKVLYTYRLIDEDRRLEIENQKRLELQNDIQAIRNKHKEPAPGLWDMKFDEQGKLTSCVWSPSFRKILGFESKGDFPNTFASWSDRIHPEDKERVLNTFWRQVKSRTEERIYDEEYRIADKNGEYRWFRACARISRRTDKTVSALDGFVVNVDEKHAAYEVLCKVVEEAEEAKNRALLENEIISSVSKLYFAIFRIDLQHDFYEEVASDNSIHLITGHAGKAQKKMNELCSTFVATEYRDMVRKFFDLSTVGERLAYTDTIEMEYHAVDGNWHEARFIEKKRDHDGNVTHILYVTRIVSREKQQELEKERLQVAYKVAESANEAKTTFLYNMSHDIRTPMNAILGYTQLMKKELHDTRLLHYQEMIEQSGNLLLSIINNVLDMARIESGKVAPDENYGEAGKIIDGVCDVFEVEAKKKQIILERQVHVEHSHILVDATKVQEIFTNLIGNAIKYTPAGGKITVTTDELPCDREGYVRIRSTVADTGIGMSKEFLPQLFDPFTRERNTTAGKVLGTGLGMAIVKSFVDLMNGTIKVESELGKGSRFTVTLEHKLADANYFEKKEVCTDREMQTDFRGKRILLAEDNDLNAEIAVTVLEEAGFQVDRASDGVVCVDKLETEPAGTYDLVLMDIQMPNMDGYKATQIIRQLSDKAKANIPIIAMTANAFEEDRQKAFSVGMNEHVAKPIDVDQIIKTLISVLGKGNQK